MKRTYKDIKNTVKMRTKSAVAAEGRIWLWYVIPPVAFILLSMLVTNLLSSSGMSDITWKLLRTVWYVGGGLIVAGIIMFVVRRRKIRGYCHSYMLEYREKAVANGYTVCPRCGSSLIKKTGTEWVSMLGSTDTVTYRNGQEISRVNNRQMKQYTYTYYECENSSCHIDIRPDDEHGSHFPEYKSLPATVKGAAALIFGGSNPSGVRISGSKGRSVARPSKAPVIILASVLILAALFCGIRYLNYNSREGDLYHHYEITEKLSGSSADFVSSINSRDSNYALWELSVTEKPDGYFANIFVFSDKTARVEHWTENGNEVFFYKFEGCDMGTGLNGRYYLTTIDGKLSIIDKSEKTIYPQGTAFFDEHYEALSAFTYDAVIPKLTEKLTGGEYGRNKDFNTTVLKTDKTSACVYDERDETRILDESGDVRLYYTASFGTGDSKQFPDFSTYKTAEK